MDVLKCFKFKNEIPGMCCSGGKVKLQELHPTPEPISNLVSGGTSQSKHFLANIRKYNYMPTFKVQVQIYHRVGSLYHYLVQITNFFKFISWETLMNKSINVPDSIPALNDKLSLHYKLYSINTTNEFKRLQLPVLLAFCNTHDLERTIGSCK